MTALFHLLEMRKALTRLHIATGEAMRQFDEGQIGKEWNISLQLMGEEFTAMAEHMIQMGKAIKEDKP